MKSFKDYIKEGEVVSFGDAHQQALNRIADQYLAVPDMELPVQNTTPTVLKKKYTTKDFQAFAVKLPKDVYFRVGHNSEYVFIHIQANDPDKFGYNTPLTPYSRHLVTVVAEQLKPLIAGVFGYFARRIDMIRYHKTAGEVMFRITLGQRWREEMFPGKKPSISVELQREFLKQDAPLAKMLFVDKSTHGYRVKIMGKQVSNQKMNLLRLHLKQRFGDMFLELKSDGASGDEHTMDLIPGRLVSGDQTWYRIFFTAELKDHFIMN